MIAISSRSKPALGESDHAVVLLLSMCLVHAIAANALTSFMWPITTTPLHGVDSDGSEVYVVSSTPGVINVIGDQYRC